MPQRRYSRNVPVLGRERRGSPARRQREGHLDAIALGDVVFGRAVFEPGWKWSECYDQMLAAEGRVLTG